MGGYIPAFANIFCNVSLFAEDFRVPVDLPASGWTPHCHQHCQRGAHYPQGIKGLFRFASKVHCQGVRVVWVWDFSYMFLNMCPS